MRRLFEVHKQLLRDEDGQSMVFGALTMFVLVCFTLMTVNVGVVASNRMHFQNASDAAAYSGALVEANAVSTIGFMNDGMAYVYYNLMRYAVDQTVYETLQKFSDAGAPDKVVWGKDEDFDSEAREVLRESQDKIQEGEELLRELRELAEGVAYAAPGLIHQEAFRIAQRNGAQEVAIYPNLEDLQRMFYPGMLEDDEGSLGELSERFAGRYEGRVLEVDGERVSIPLWFNKWDGKSRSFPLGYIQIRTCWNRLDLGHTDTWSGPSDPHGLYTMAFQYDEAPNAHWHRGAFHPHVLDFPPYVLIHDQAHHSHWSHAITADGNAPHHFPVPFLYEYPCPTCSWIAFVEDLGLPQLPDWDMDQHSDVMQIGKVIELDVPKPLVVSEQLFEVGINVAVHSDATGSFLSDLFEDPEWGYVSVASAKIGPVQGGGVIAALTNDTGLRGRFVDSSVNLFETNWGARLVPTPKGMDEPIGQWLNELLTGQQSWKSSWDGSYRPNLGDQMRSITPPDDPTRFDPSSASERDVRH